MGLSRSQDCHVQQPAARSDILTGAPNDTEYDAVYAAVTATERGRRFLTEFAKRNRHAEPALPVAPPDDAQAAAPQPRGQTEAARHWHIEAPDFVFDRPSADANNNDVEASQAHPLLAGTQPPLRPSNDPDDLFEHLPSDVIAPIAEVTAPPQLRIANGAQAHPRSPSRDPLADLHSLSEEELIALFG